jgi:hypothetical protein
MWWSRLPGSFQQSEDISWCHNLQTCAKGMRPKMLNEEALDGK